MKSLLRTLLLLPLLLPSLLPAQTPSSCTVPPNLRQYYERDVANLAVQQMYASGSPDTLMVRIPSMWTDPIWDGLAAIYNVSGIPERDSVYDLYCVHDYNYQRQNYSSFLVKVDTSYAWTQAWQNQTTLTGDPLMDLILTKYDVRLTNFYNWSIGNYAELATDSIWNDYGLMDSLRMVNGVLFVEQNAIFGAAGVITYVLTVDGHRLDFYMEFNDCFDGCDNYRRWKFLVAPNCDVTYLGFDDWWTFSHDPLPSPTNCNITTGMAPEAEAVAVQLVPNPAHGRVRILVTEDVGELEVELTDMTGRVLQRRTGLMSGGELETAGLPAGMYVVRVRDAAGRTWSGRLIED